MILTSQLLYTLSQDAMGIITPGAEYPDGPEVTHAVKLVNASYTLRIIKPEDLLLRFRLQITNDRHLSGVVDWTTSGTWLNVGDETDVTVELSEAAYYIRFEVEYISGEGTAEARLSQGVESPAGVGPEGPPGPEGPAGADGTIPDGDLGDITVSGTGTVLTIDNDVVTFAKMQNISNSRLIGRASASTGDPEEVSISQAMDFISETQGAVLYRAAGNWAALGVGTAGQVLTTNGAAANPSWETPVTASVTQFDVVTSAVSSFQDANGQRYVPLRQGETDTQEMQCCAPATGTASLVVVYAMSVSNGGAVELYLDSRVSGDGDSLAAAVTAGTQFTVTPGSDTLRHSVTSSDSADLSFVVTEGDLVYLKLGRTADAQDTHTGDMRVYRVYMKVVP